MPYIPVMKENNSRASVGFIPGLPAEVLEFQAFMLLHGGHSGGWEEYDHRIFLKCREKHKGKLGFIGDVAERLCGQTVDSVQEHETWYQDYFQKRENQRLAIEEWKHFKKLMEQVEQESKQNLKEVPWINRELSKEVKASVTLWKQQVEEENRLKLKKAAEEEMKVLQNNLQKRKTYQEELHKKVEAYRELRKAQKDLDQEQLNEAKRREELERQSSRIPLGHFVQKDAIKLQEKWQKREKIAEEIKTRQLRLEKLAKQVSVEAKKDPERLLKPTKAWAERITPSKPEEHAVRAPFLLSRRGTPVWRRGITF